MISSHGFAYTKDMSNRFWGLQGTVPSRRYADLFCTERNPRRRLIPTTFLRLGCGSINNAPLCLPYDLSDTRTAHTRTKRDPPPIMPSATITNNSIPTPSSAKPSFLQLRIQRQRNTGKKYTANHYTSIRAPKSLRLERR